MPYNRDVFTYLPPQYSEFLESREMLRVYEDEYRRLFATIDEFPLQFRVSTATYGLREWERIAGIPTDISKSLGERRSNIIARLRGASVITATTIANVAEAYSGGEVSVTVDSPNYTVNIEFTGTLGVPSNVADLQAILREIIPAHLNITYTYKYILYRDIQANYANYNDILATGKTYTQLREEG